MNKEDLLQQFNREPVKQGTQICLHTQCTECNGTGRKKNGQQCVHYISCPCPKCTPVYVN